MASVRPNESLPWISGGKVIVKSSLINKLIWEPQG